MQTLLTISIFFWCIGFVVIWKIPRCTRYYEGKSAPPSISVIIPARDEEKNIQTLLVSLAEQSLLPLEILVCDDHSTDRTAEISGQNGATVLKMPEKPSDWTGKNWALWQGANVAKGGLYLFLDADTKLEPDGIERLVKTWMQGKGIVTVQPFSVIERFYEGFSAFFNLLLMAGVTAFTLFGNRVKSAGGFGACFLCHREDYFKLDGHRSVRSLVLENLALGQRYQQTGGNLRCFGGRDTISIRMYPHGLKDLINGWTKGFASGAVKTRPFWMLLIILWISGMFQVLRALITVTISPDQLYINLTLLLYLMYMIQLARVFRKIGNFGQTPVIFFPVYLIFFIAVFAWSFIKIFWLKSVRWKGRDLGI